MKRFALRFLLGMLAGAAPVVASAQAAVGDGLRGDYYDGLNFEHHIQTRRDAHIDFYWHDEKPISGVPAEQFSVRWTGWLVPPVTGHYVVHLSVDDGARLWLDGKQVLNEWRGQSLSYFDVPIDLVGGRPYRLRLDYCQYSHDARVLLLWERPRQPQAPRASSWRNLWGMAEKVPTFASRFQETIPTRYLYTHLPPPPKLAVNLAMAAVVARQPPAPLAAPTLHRAASSPLLPKPRVIIKLAKPVRRSIVTRSQLASTAATRQSQAQALAARLLSGQVITPRTLYFEQGQVVLLPAVRASLDTLAQVLSRYPSLRLEVQGHTDNQGNPTINQQLSLRRAEAVCQYLSAQRVDPSRLIPLGFGGTQPVADNSVPTERPRNRRVVLRPVP
jgi:outer membrane protein OmpA-like peptidoglycan-associated protein